MGAEIEKMSGSTPLIKTEPKDIFTHLLAIAALYLSAVSFLVFMFQYIDHLLPDRIDANYYSQDSNLDAMRWAIATLVIFFPTYVATSRFLNKGYRESPSKRNLRVRKWLIYFTLFVAALILLGDLVTLMYRFLNGDLTLRFILKVVAVFFVAGSVFYYYLWDVRRIGSNRE